mmetsp:Transcript_74133/g.191228  ORF Transcript_74133/g.191228 Transcript_74133/m.191228 type:complete len:311 (-) Transcript_74133:251-1183(-)
MSTNSSSSVQQTDFSEVAMETSSVRSSRTCFTMRESRMMRNNLKIRMTRRTLVGNHSNWVMFSPSWIKMTTRSSTLNGQSRIRKKPILKTYNRKKISTVKTRQRRNSRRLKKASCSFTLSDSVEKSQFSAKRLICRPLSIELATTRAQLAYSNLGFSTNLRTRLEVLLVAQKPRLHVWKVAWRAKEDMLRGCVNIGMGASVPTVAAVRLRAGRHSVSSCAPRPATAGSEPAAGPSVAEVPAGTTWLREASLLLPCTSGSGATTCVFFLMPLNLRAATATLRPGRTAGLGAYFSSSCSRSWSSNGSPPGPL